MQKLIRLGYIDLSFHAASAALIQHTLERHGYLVRVSTAHHEDMFRMYRDGQVDMLVSAWLPASHGAYLAARKKPSVKLGVLYRPYCIWGVPDYVPEDEVAAVGDLLKPDVARRMSKRIQGINPGAGISRFSQAMVIDYALDQGGYYFANGSEADCFTRFEHAYASGEWLVVPLWHPQYLHHTYSIRALDEPRGLLGGEDQATLVASSDVVQAMPKALIDDLASLQPGNAVISELDYLIRRKGYSALEAADIWIERQSKLEKV
ncbi:glycine/betaine ABC transporter substrate-binding protein [Pseudomonas sp. C1C7]|uniref:glycine betaine ABC transporter substrate-binding protein n=1 Tax=Pseudomonas sp. C1C7 TaxID=2735272 RepID=UPI001586230B|nr:glycine betaine ABC transporter substrate-binding protein [Pseudomonas sp. C1C7]NUT79065.1 glycine/betaine ABC transporter substrate-binding protein [Pseudomonas sp. C1C7]